MDSNPPLPPAPITVDLKTKNFMVTLWAIAGGLVGVHVVLNIIHYQFLDLPWLLRQIFDVDEEDSFPTWYSGMILFVTSITAALNARRESVRGGALAPQWTMLGIGFLLLSIDEIAGMHETLNSSVSFSWTIPGAIVAAFAGGLLVPFLWKLPRAYAVRFVIAGAIYLGGALGVEVATDPYAENDALNTLAYNLWTAVEELMEMAGVLIFLEGARRLLVERPPEVSATELKVTLR